MSVIRELIGVAMIKLVGGALLGLYHARCSRSRRPSDAEAMREGAHRAEGHNVGGGGGVG